MTLSKILYSEAESAPYEKEVEDRDVDNLSFTINQQERSLRIPETTENKRVIISKSELSESTQERISYKEVDDKFVQWIGRVLEINGETFTARIDPIRYKTTSKIARFNIKKVVVVNGELLEEGATFYWTVGLFRNPKGSFVKRSEVRFRFPIIPNREAVDELAWFKAKSLFEGIGWLE